MPLDGMSLHALTRELDGILTGGRVEKVLQPEKDEIHLIIKNQRQTFRLLLSASASLPLIYLTEKPKSNPMTAPNFCMLLRKYLMNGKILDVTQPGLERILVLHIEHVDEMGDLCVKKYGVRLFYPSDEFYITAGLEMPDEDWYDGYPQIENGVGLTTSLMTEVNDAVNSLDFTVHVCLLQLFNPAFGKGNGNPLWYSCLGNPMDRGA